MSHRFTSIYFDSEMIDGRAVDIFEPVGEPKDTVVFLVHGGGWKGGSRVQMHRLMGALMRKGYVCAATDYRLGGATAFDQLTDVRQGYDHLVGWLKAHDRPQRVVAYGSSAGAHLALLMALARPGEAGERKSFRGVRPRQRWVAPIGIAVQSAPVTFEPWEDIFPAIWSAMQAAAGAAYERTRESYRRLSPIRYVCRTSPPMLLMHAENEHMFPLGLTRNFIARAKQVGVRATLKRYPAAEHGFFYDVTRRPQRMAWADLLRFIESVS